MAIDEANEAASNSCACINSLPIILEFLNMDPEAGSITGGMRLAREKASSARKQAPQLAKTGGIIAKQPKGRSAAARGRGANHRGRQMTQAWGGVRRAAWP